MRGAMVVWGLLIVLLVGVGFATWFVGLVLTGAGIVPRDVVRVSRARPAPRADRAHSASVRAALGTPARHPAARCRALAARTPREARERTALLRRLGARARRRRRRDRAAGRGGASRAARAAPRGGRCRHAVHRRRRRVRGDARARRQARRRGCASRRSLRSSASRRCHVTLVQAIAANDTMDFVVRKAVELGAHAIAPVTSERSARLPAGERGDKRLRPLAADRLSPRASNAAATAIPEVHAPVALSAWLQGRAGRAGILLDAGRAVGRSRCRRRPGALDVLVGPEGGLDRRRDRARGPRRAVVPVRMGRACCAPRPRRHRGAGGDQCAVGRHAMKRALVLLASTWRSAAASRRPRRRRRPATIASSCWARRARPSRG